MNKNNMQECEVVQDLLPLYYDEVCSPASKKLVQQHLETCESCKKMYDELKNNTVGTIIREESEGVIKRHAKKEKTAAYKAGAVIALLLMVPVVITFLVSVGDGGGFGVLAVLAASMLLIAAVTVIPLMSSGKKLVRSILTGVAALLLIIFFVDRMNGGGEFMLTAIPTIFGLSVVLFPFVIRGITLPPVLADKKALITLAWDTLWLYLTIFEVCNYNGDTEGMREGCIAATVLMSGVWLVFLVVRYLPANKWIKAGIIVMTGSIWTAFANDVCVYFIEHKKQLTILLADFSDWSREAAYTSTYNANVYVLLLLAGGIVGILLIAIGVIKKRRGKNR